MIKRAGNVTGSKVVVVESWFEEPKAKAKR